MKQKMQSLGSAQVQPSSINLPSESSLSAMSATRRPDIESSEGGALRVLLTEGTSLSSRHTIYALGSQHTLDVMDPRSLCLGRFSSSVRRWYRCPSYSIEPARFMEFLVQQLRENRYDVLLPTHEQVFLLSRFRRALSQHVGVALPEFSALQQLFDKASFVRILRELALPHPHTVLITSRQELDREWDYPRYLKIAHSTAGCGVHLVHNRHELCKLSQQLETAGYFDGRREILVQAPARGVQSTVQTVFQHGRLVGAHCFEARELGVGGMSAARTAAVHPVVLRHMATLGAHLNWHGACFLDYFFDRQTQRPEYLEANPRLGETVNAWLSGANLAELLLRVSTGEQLPAMDEHPQLQVGVRTHSGLMRLISAAHDGAGRWSLLQEIWRQRTGQGLYAQSQDELTRPGDDALSRLPYLWIAMQLLFSPRRAQQIVRQTVNTYSLPESAIASIMALPADTVERLWARNVG